METLKKIINIIVMIYLVVAALIYLDILNIGQSNPGFYTTFFVIGGIIMLLELLIENLYYMSLKRGQVDYQHKINELKATLYDQKQEIQELKDRQNQPPATQKEIKIERDTSRPDDIPATAPVGTPPIPVEPSVDSAFASNPDTNTVIITTDSTTGTRNQEQRFPENPDSKNKHDRNY